MDESMRERVARAIVSSRFGAAMWDSLADDPALDSREWRNEWLSAADAALAAMLYVDGTDEHLAIEVGNQTRIDAVIVIECWDGMINAALKGETSDQ